MLAPIAAFVTIHLVKLRAMKRAPASLGRPLDGRYWAAASAAARVDAKGIAMGIVHRKRRPGSEPGSRRGPGAVLGCLFAGALGQDRDYRFGAATTTAP